MYVRKASESILSGKRGLLGGLLGSSGASSSSEDKNSPVQQLELLEQVGVAALIFNWSVVKVDVKSQGPGISQVTLASWRRWWLAGATLTKLPQPLSAPEYAR